MRSAMRSTRFPMIRDLERIEERLDQLYKLSRKYGETEEEMIAYLENAQKELDEIAFSEERTEALHGERRNWCVKSRRWR